LIAYSDSEIFNHVFDSKIGQYTTHDKYVLFSEDFSYEKLLVTNYIPLICLLFHKNIKQNLLFDESFDLYEDWDLLIRLGEIYHFHHVKKVTARYNRNLSDQISTNGKLHYHGFIKIMNKHKQKITPGVLFSSWKTSVRERELSHLREKLEAKIHIMERYLEEKEGLLEKNCAHVKNLENIINEKDKNITKNEQLLAGQERVISQKHREMLDMQIMIENIHNSFGWSMLEIARKIWIRLFPPHTRRRYYSDLLIKSIKVIKIHGFKVYYNKASRKLNTKNHYKPKKNDAFYCCRYKQGLYYRFRGFCFSCYRLVDLQ